jgi:hypothetical protein
VNGFRRKGAVAPAVGSFVPRLTRKAMEKYGFSAAALITDWGQIAGADIARYTAPQRLKWPRGVEAYGEIDEAGTGRPGATLVLRVDSARALDVQYNAKQLIERINGYFGYKAVAQLRIVQGPIGAGDGPKPRQVLGAQMSAPRSRGGAAAAVDLKAIKDDGLRTSLERLQQAMSRERAAS